MPHEPLIVRDSPDTPGDRQPFTAKDLPSLPGNGANRQSNSHPSGPEDSDSTADLVDLPSEIARGMSVNGDVETAGVLRVSGSVEGQVRAGEVEVRTDGVVNGNVQAKAARVAGTVNGNIQADNVALTATAQVNGDINHRALSVEAGAVLNGSVRRMDESSDETDETVAKPKTDLDDSLSTKGTPEIPSMGLPKGTPQKLSAPDLSMSSRDKLPLTARDKGRLSPEKVAPPRGSISAND